MTDEPKMALAEVGRLTPPSACAFRLCNHPRAAREGRMNRVTVSPVGQRSLFEQPTSQLRATGARHRHAVVYRFPLPRR